MGFAEAETTYGKIRGSREAGVNILKGIPYAGQVSGEHRFRQPAELQPWLGVRDALELGPPAIQPPRRNEPEPAVAGNWKAIEAIGGEHESPVRS
jgi:para-nitrobenzyl esterase